MSQSARETIIFYDADFPGGERPQPDVDELLHIGKVVGAGELAEALRESPGGCFLTLHAPYFPKAAWSDIAAYLARGGGLVSFGGAPFKVPVRSADDAWVAEPEQTGYHRRLRIHETLRVDAGPVVRLSANEDIPIFAGKEALFPVAADSWNLVPHVTKSSDLPHQMGSAGPMDAHLYPLLKGISAEGREVAAPAVLWENTKGEFAGGRWLFMTQPVEPAFWANGGAKALGEWSSFCAGGVTELWMKPNYASYEPGERAMLTFQMQRLGHGDAAAETKTWKLSVAITHQVSDKPVWEHTFTVPATNRQHILRIPVPVSIERGWYQVLCTAVSEDGETRRLRQGFWGRDDAFLAEGSPVTAGRDYFEKDGRPLPVVGMTYMTSDVARKFLFLPNADVWDRDMAQMRKAGINWIRTGVWTAYRNMMQVDGHASEEVLRSIDAFLLTAKKHDLQVTFTFFSFTPEPWEGVNPYLDPRSVEAQKRFIQSIVSRHRATTNVDWDLINEPSMFDPKRIFSNGPRSSRDAFEQEAFAKWLKERHGAIETLQERWNMTPEQLPDFAAATLPEPEDINFDVQDMHQGKNGTRWLDYVLFSMEMHNRWARQLYEAIKAECPEHLVTVGQDEALGAQRPSPFFYAEAVDYTTVHSWWLNDQLVWDGVFAKTHEKPNLIQETGIMYVETPEGRAKRSELELRNILERKYAYAFSTGGAGAVQWIWNTNFYMDNANESHIGALRADGTEKPEANVSYDFGRFMEGIRDLFRGRRVEDVAVVFPYTNDFSNRKLAFDATTRLTRALAYELKMPFRGVGEYHLDALEKAPAKLIMVPSPHNMDDAAFHRLLDIANRTAAVVLFTGPMNIDAYWRTTERLNEALNARRLVNVVREEALDVLGEIVPVSFGNRRIAEVWKEVPNGQGSGQADQMIDVPLGSGGRLIWSPLPVELNDRSEPILALYDYALRAAGIEPEMEWIHGGRLPGVYGRKLRFDQGSLWIFVSEFGHDTPIEVGDPETGRAYSFVLAKERSVLFAGDAEGRLLSVYRPEEMDITVT